MNLVQEDPSTRMAVQESLSMMSDAFKSLDSANAKLMEALIHQNIEKVSVEYSCYTHSTIKDAIMMLHYTHFVVHLMNHLSFNKDDRCKKMTTCRLILHQFS